MAQMFPSSNNGNVDPIYYSDLQVHHRPFFNDITSSFKYDHQDFFLFQSPTPFSPPSYDQLGLQDHDIFLHDQNHESFLPSDATAIAHMMDSTRNNDDRNEVTKICKRKSNGSEQMSNPRKKSSKRDRHSKINTAQGPRDRRMRLSLKVARDFFDLQDKLGFDKASKTVEWLLLQARQAIKNISSTLPHMSNHSSSARTKSASSTSECEVVSEIDEAAAAVAYEPSISKGQPSSSCVNRGSKKSKPPRKSTFHSIDKESRDKARARARERAREKERSRRMMDESKLNEEVKNNELNQLSCLTSFDTTAEKSGTRSHTTNKNPSMKMLAETEETPISCHDQQQQQLLVTTDGMIDDSWVIMGKWSPSFVIGHLYNTSMPEENHQITDLQSFCKSWEVAHNS